MPKPGNLLHTANTMNGWKPLIFLHEAEIDYDMVPISSMDAMPKVQEALQLPQPRPSAFGKGDIDAAAKANTARFKEA